MDDIFNVNFNEIELGKNIGHGSFGIVYKANWNDPGVEDSRTVAVKIIENQNHNSDQENIQFNKNIPSEIRILTTIAHQNIVTLYGVSKNPDNKICLLFEYAENGSLYNFLHRSKTEISFNSKIDWMLQCAKGMDYLHNKKIIHRDLKTQNLLLFNEYRDVKICDFGTVKEFVTKNTSLVGTIGYMAPEVYSQNGKYNDKCDVFSFGIVFWEVMARKKPVHTLSNVNGLGYQKQVVDGTRPSIDEMMIYEESDCIKPIIEMCWDGIPENRPSMKELCDLLPIYPLAYSNINSNDIKVDNFIGRKSYGFVHKGYWSKKDKVALKIIDRFDEEKQISEKDKVALKILDRFDEEKQMSFLKDIRNVQKLNHDNIVTLYGVSKPQSNLIYLVFEYSDCGSLYDYVHSRKHKISYNDKFEWMLQCAMGMEYLHSKNIVLLDLKTEKLLLFDNYRTLKICYSGPVKEFAIRNAQYVGTGSYMAPEICNASGEYTAKCDVFSFGIIFWEVMARKKPFDENNEMDVKKKIIDGVRPDINYLDTYKEAERIQPIITKCWDHEPSNRPTMKELCELLLVYARVSSRINYNDIKFDTLIGNGSYGVVYKAIWQDERDRSQVIAVKMIQGAKEEKVIQNEIHNLTLLNHDNIATLYGYAIDAKYRICMLVEYAVSGTVYNFLHYNIRKLSFLETLTWLLQCAEGMKYLHEKKIIHRDLKTQNLLLFDEFRKLKICDFGKIKKYASIKTEFKGTNCCKAPEVYANEKYTEKSDVFSLGIISWEIMSRKKPFDDLQNMQSNLDIKKKIIDGDRPNINDVMSHRHIDFIKPTIQRCWDQDPEIRPTMEELCVLLQIYPSVNFDDLQLVKLIENSGYNDNYKGIWKIYEQERVIAISIKKKLQKMSLLDEMKLLQKSNDLKQLNHPNVVIWYGISKAGFNSFYILTEYSECGSVHYFLHNTKNDVSYDDKKNWMLQCAKGLEYLQSKNITLWVLKAQLLMLFDQYRTLKIHDSGGSVKHLKSINKDGIFDGYLAPEIYDERAVCNSEKTEVFSFGIWLWEVMSRKKPYYEYRSESQNIQKNVVAGYRPNLSDIKNDDDAHLIKPMIEKCWSKNVELRPTMRDLCSTLTFLLNP